MDYTGVVTAIGAAVAGLTLVGAAAFGIHMLIKGFTWGRRLAK